MASFGGRVMERSQSKNQASDSDSAGEGVGWQSAGDTSRIMDKALELNRKKDIICLILSYPPFSSVIQGSHKGWILDVLAINQKLREAVYRKKVINVSELFSRISRQIDHSIDDIEAYVPRHIIEEMQRGTIWGRTPTTKVYSLAIDFAVRQIIQDRETPEFQRIYISGRDDAGILMSRLKNLQQEKGMFDLAIHVKASSCKTAGDIEYGIARELGLSTSSRQEVDVLLQSKSFLILLDGVDLASSTNLSEVGTNWWNSKKFQKMVCTTSSMGRGVNHTEVDLEIRLEDHLLTWELFCMNVGNVVHSSGIQRLAIRVVKECEGHLLAIVLMARALREVDEVHTWEYASHALALQPTRLRDYVLFNALAFICGRLGSAMYCLKFFVHMGCWREIEKGDVIGRWISGGLIRKADEGEEMVRDLVDAFLLESSGNGDSVFLRVRGEIYEALLILLGHKTELLFLWQCGKGLTDPPIEEMWKTASEVHLMNNKLSELPKSPDCPQLRALFLQANHGLRVIPPMFFKGMPFLQFLDLSNTAIRSLPPSLFKLVQLRIFLLRGCQLLMELPPEVGCLRNLEVFDLEGTEIISLPVNLRRLTNLNCLRVSFYGYSNHTGQNNQSSNTMIPQNVISELSQLKELGIHVNPDDERWDVIVKYIVKEVCTLKHLETLKLYLPEVRLVNDFMGSGNSLINLSQMNFEFIIGSHHKRFVSRLPQEIANRFEQQERCLKYVNGEGVSMEIKEVLQHATTLLLERHLTLTKLSEFGIENIMKLEFCVLGECSKIQTLVDGAETFRQGDDDGDVHQEIILGSLQYLRLHYMKNLDSIWKGPIWKGCLSSLKSLELYACPQLTTTFTLGLLENLDLLEELVVENCPNIISLVTYEVPAEHTLLCFKTYLPKLKKISLHYLRKLASISSGLRIAPDLEWMSFYNCPSIEALSNMEVSSNNLKVIIGEADWWRALKWQTSVLRSNLDSIFVPIKSDVDLMTQLAEIKNQLLAPKQERNPSQQSGSGDSLKALAVETLKALAAEAGTTSVDKQRHKPSPLPLLSPSTKSFMKASVVEAGTTSEQKWKPHTLKMTDEAEVDLQRIRGSLLTSVSSETACMKDLKENYEMLIGGAKQLKALRNGMEMEIRRHNIRPHIREWLAKVERINIEVNQLETLYNDEMKHPGRPVRFWECSNLSKYMEKKHEEVHSLLKEGIDKRRVLVAELSEFARKIPAPKIEDSSLCNVVEDVVSFLQDKQIRRIGIWGTVGTGKTTIMKNVIDHKDVAKIFDMVIWVTVSKEWSKKTFQDAIMQRLKMNMKGSVSIEENSLRISEELKGKKCLILLDEVYDFIDLDEVIGINQSHESKVVLASRLRDICKGMEADELINVKPLSDHEAFNMFREKLGQSIYSPQIERVAEQVVRECGGLPLLINIVAMIFRNKRQDISLWMDGLKHLQRWEDIDGMDHVIEFLKSCYDYLDSDTKKACYLYCALFPGEYDINVDYLLECWKAEGFIQNADEFVRGTDAFRDARSKGHAILDDLINLSLLERSDKGKCVKMNRMLRKMALKISFQSNGSKFLAKPCEGLQDFPGRKEWEDANRISLMDNELCTLPEFLHCHNLSTLLLQRNNGLIAIPKFFFQSMHSLRVLDLHGTGIESLPSSISDLICLRGLYLNSCTHLIQLPPNIRALDQLELLDIRGTKLNLLQIGSLIWLKCLRISSNFFIGIHTQRKLGNISRFVSLEEFCVDDDLSVEWRYKASEIVMEVATLHYKLTSLKFCFPTMHFLQFFVQTSPAWKKKCFSFQFSVGYQDSTYSYFLESSSDYPSYNSLKLVNGEGWHPVIKHVLKVTNAFGLINHKGVSALSNFGTNNMKNMHVCLVDGCNEIRVIINGCTTGKRVLENLKILYINNVPKLRSIWQGFVPDGSLAQLTTLTLTKCPELKRIFSSGMIQQLPRLQHLRVEECYQIEEIIMVSENHGLNVDALPRLKTLVLIDLPELRSIWVDDSLEWPSLQRIKISMCYMLKRLPFNNANAAKLRFIEGQELWWKALVWKDDAVKQRLKFLCILN